MAIIGKSPEDVVDRKGEICRIVDSMKDPKSNVNYALVGHRRIGKSTIMLEVKKRLERRGDTMVGYVDLGGFRHSPVDLAESLTEELTGAYSRTLPKSSRTLGSVGSALPQIAETRRLRARFTHTSGTEARTPTRRWQTPLIMPTASQRRPKRGPSS